MERNEHAPGYDGEDGQDLIVVVSRWILGVLCATDAGE